MGAKKEKYARRIEERVRAVENRMDKVELRQTDSDMFNRCLEETARRYSETSNSERAQYRHDLRLAKNEARRWKLNAYLTLALLTLVAAVCLVWVSAEEPQAPQDGPVVQAIPADESLPGDDIPALVRCYMTPEEIEADENVMIEAALLARSTRLDNVTVTHYCTCSACCGWDTGITASGVRATPGVTVAVDPDVIPLGVDVLVDYGDGEIQYYRADDTGNAVKGNRIDVCVGSHDEAMELGRRTATVWWVMPE